MRGVARRQYYSGERACLLVILHQYLTNFALIFHIGLFISAYMCCKKDFAGAVRVAYPSPGLCVLAVRVDVLYSKRLSSCNPVVESRSLTRASFPGELCGTLSPGGAKICCGLRFAKQLLKGLSPFVRVVCVAQHCRALGDFFDGRSK